MSNSEEWKPRSLPCYLDCYSTITQFSLLKKIKKRIVRRIDIEVSNCHRDFVRAGVYSFQHQSS